MSIPTRTDGWGSLNEGQRLRPSEIIVLKLLAQGKTNSEIATATGLSPNTVKHYAATIYLKLGVRRRAELVREAIGHLASLEGESL